MSPSDITIVTAVDAAYIDKLVITYDTWVKYKPEIKEMPLLLIYDADQLKPTDRRFDKFKAHKGAVLYPWTFSQAESQREKMLTSFVVVPPNVVKTPWHMKIDADTVATKKGKWLDFALFGGESGPAPAFISNPWSYTKPVEFFDRLEEWGNNHPEISKFPTLTEKFAQYEEEDDNPRDRLVRGETRMFYPRIISWLCFINTEYSKKLLELCPNGKLPVPSQDTFLHYVTARTGWKHWIRVSYKRLGWGHLGRRKVGQIKDFVGGLDK